MFFFPVGLHIVSCANTKATKKDPFLEQWKNLAEKSQGYSPTIKPKHVSIPKESNVEDESLLKRLPTLKMNVRLRKADVKSTLLSMARSTNLNMLIKENVKGEISMDLNDVPWDRAFKAILRMQGLTYSWEGDILQIMSIEDVNLDTKVAAAVQNRNAQEIVKKRVEPLVTVLINIDYADPEKLMHNLLEFMMKDDKGKTRGSIKVDEHSNSMIVQAIREDLDKMIALIKKIDRPTPQVLIKANIVETTKETARALGVQWGGLVGGNPQISAGGTSKDGVIIPPFGATGISGQGFNVNFPITDEFGEAGGAGSLGILYGLSDSSVLELQLQALQRENRLNILSSPSLTTLDNQTSFTETGEKVPYVSTATAGGALTQNVQFVEVVLRLEITPHVIDGEYLKMKILVKKDEVDPVREVQGNPFIIKKQTNTTLIVSEGQTIVISGLTKQRNTALNSGIPVLRDIPGVRWLFQRDSKSDIMQEIIIFITPKILPPQTKKEVAMEAEKSPEQEKPEEKALTEAEELPIQEKSEDLIIQSEDKESVGNMKQDEIKVQMEIEKSPGQEKTEEKALTEAEELPIQEKSEDLIIQSEDKESVGNMKQDEIKVQTETEESPVQEEPEEVLPEAEESPIQEKPQDLIIQGEGSESVGNMKQGEINVQTETEESSVQEEPEEEALPEAEESPVQEEAEDFIMQGEDKESVGNLKQDEINIQTETEELSIQEKAEE